MKIKLSLVSIILVYANSIYGMTPQEKLFVGIREGDIALVEETLKKGTDVNSQNNIGYTVFMYAAYKGHIDIVKRLIDAGANVNIRNRNGQTALMEAINYEDHEVVKTNYEDNEVVKTFYC